MRTRYHRQPGPAGTRDYTVRVQARPRGRWATAGTVSRFGTRTWAALGADATAWTRYRATRDEAVRDMLAGRTFLSHPEAGAR